MIVIIDSHTNIVIHIIVTVNQYIWYGSQMWTIFVETNQFCVLQIILNLDMSEKIILSFQLILIDGL